MLILYWQIALLLHDGENTELQREVNSLLQQPRLAAAPNSQRRKSGKYMKYKRHEETRIIYLLQLHFPLSNITGYNLDGKNQLAREAALTLHPQQFEYLLK